MVYSRYILKNGKKYGPYYYESKRIGKKTSSVYVGKEQATEVKEHREEKVTALPREQVQRIFALGILGFVFVLVVVGVAFFFHKFL